MVSIHIVPVIVSLIISKILISFRFKRGTTKGASPTTDGAPILIEIGSKQITCDVSGSAASASFPS